MTDDNQDDTQQPSLSNAVQVKVEQRVAEYINCRDALKKRKDEYEESIEALVDLQNRLTGWLQSFMEKAGADNIKTSRGTCYHSTKYTASLADSDIFMKFVIETQNFDLLDRKANVTAVKAYVAETGNLPPGANLSSIKTVGVRRPTTK
jgi:hypothetical protein